MNQFEKLMKEMTLADARCIAGIRAYLEPPKRCYDCGFGEICGYGDYECRKTQRKLSRQEWQDAKPADCPLVEVKESEGE
jgi:ribosomal protein L37E